MLKGIFTGKGSFVLKSEFTGEESFVLEYIFAAKWINGGEENRLVRISVIYLEETRECENAGIWNRLMEDWIYLFGCCNGYYHIFHTTLHSPFSYSSL